MINFTKMQGCGNDYIYINCFDNSIDNPSKLAIELSNRNYGIGSDGLILICPSDIADIKMVMFNSDGTESEMCGNGIRCVGKFAYDNKLISNNHIFVETKAGIKELFLNIRGSKVNSVTVNMGAAKHIYNDEYVDYSLHENHYEELTINNMSFVMNRISVGNPHAVIEVSDLNSIDIKELGPIIECDPLFPYKTNVEFVELLSRNHLKVYVWERGTGETLACGTGASAVYAAFLSSGRVDKNCNIEMKGGTLSFKLDESNNILMTGPAVTVYEGSYYD